MYLQNVSLFVIFYTNINKKMQLFQKSQIFRVTWITLFIFVTN